MTFLYLLAILIALGILFAYLAISDKKALQNLEKSRALLKDFATAHNLTFEQNYNNEESLTGTYKNIQISLYEETFDNGRYVFFSTIMAAYLPQTTTLQNLEIQPRTLRSKITPRSAPQNTQTGIPALDKHFTVRGVPEPRIKEIFTHPDITNALLHLHKSGKNVHLSNDILSVKYPNHLAQNFHRIPDTLNALIQCIQALEQTNNTPPNLLPKENTTLFSHPNVPTPEKTQPLKNTNA